LLQFEAGLTPTDESIMSLAPKLDPHKLIAVHALIRSGADPSAIQRTVNIKDRSLAYYKAELRRLEEKARQRDDQANPYDP
jgi:hypothetical protein